MSFQPDEDSTSQSGKDMQNMMQRMVIVSIGQAAARIVNVNKTEIGCGRFEQLQVCTKFKHRSIYCDLTLKFYGLSAPEGSIAEVCFGMSTFFLGQINIEAFIYGLSPPLSISLLDTDIYLLSCEDEFIYITS